MAVYIFGATGDTIIEKGGHLNMGVPGIMFFGAYGGILGTLLYVNGVPADAPLNTALIIIISIIFATLFAAIGGLIYCVLTVSLKCNQNIVGLSITTFGIGLSRYLISVLPTGNLRLVEAGRQIQNLFPGYMSAGTFGEMFLSGSFFTYFAIILAVVVSVILAKTKVGLNLRAVGENPASADAAGINVNAYRYLSTIIGSAIVGIGGLVFLLDCHSGSIDPTDAVDSYGWLTLSIVILSAWHSWISILISFAIGMLNVLPIIFTDPAVTNLIRTIPYVATIVVLIVASVLGSKKLQPPAGLGQNYFREDR
ncbi:MAG: ABC transporter permease [Bacilli bacterium]|nr:ABC transporter permease [Bacilli bacterium]